ncbi:MAG: FHA domain-containing protein [Rhodocyclaceae bacterium]|nr:FHA domain-containing protein [Rhodocyclaceae bacterium]MCB1900011.1 FHA domain-containing protein [Rhodocyclaceae bacterium]MCP5310624.1 FHA domain-containing protein [Zoogloeaceae bacterium]
MGQRRNRCVLFAELFGGARAGTRSDYVELAHAAERSINRVERVVESNSGSVIARTPNSLTVRFEECDAGVLAACEMQDRVSGMLPVMGVRIMIRIGVHYGPVDEVSNATEPVAAFAERLAGLARPGEALASGEAVMLLGSATRHFAGAEPIAGARAEALEWPVYLLGRRIGVTTSAPPAALITPRLRLKHQNDVLILEEARPIMLLGREQGNDIVIIDPRASRQHARIERRREGFVLVDQSTNGTFVADGEGRERCIKREDVVLGGQGRIGCGFSANDVERDLVFYEVV